ncbi:calmodulin-binding protein 60 F-like [Oryza brachyantha]|uniref:calmodulin-binding protein 60 F-like n=1 Tax=Oryza brachyantha TaxID=4533 RepID=UPI001AD9E1AB|nr:calmodulin-binding protein 60 F-like [Oryza brachyantha]
MHQKRPAPAAQAPAVVPAPKRLQVAAAAAAVGVGGGGGGSVAVATAQPAPTSPPGKRHQLRSGMLVLFFVAQVKEELRCNRRLRRVIRGENAISQKKAIEEFDCVFQKAFDNAFQKHLDPIYRSLQSLTRRTDNLSHEVEQIKHSSYNNHANERYSRRSEPNQEPAEEMNQEQQAIRFAATEQRFELRFLNKLNPLVYTKDKITAEDGAAIKIAIFQNNQIVKSGPLSSARIEILALEGDFIDVVPDNWTESQFASHIPNFPQGPVLGGVCQIKLKNGEASSSDVSFNMPSSKTPSGKFILAARVHSSDQPGFRIMEALMNPAVVQVHRNKLNRSSDRPKLKDEVHRLKGISRTGCRAKWLKDNQINTVEEFIKALNKDEEKIRNECFKLKKDNKDWKDTVTHARECDLEGNRKLKSYRVEEQNVVLFFNCVHDLVGAAFRGCYASKNTFSSDQQETVNFLKKQAYDVLDDIAFDDKMKDNYPESLSSTLNTSIGDHASIRFTYTAPNPPDLHFTYQVQDIAAAEICHANELLQEHPNSNNDSGQHFLHGYQGNQAVAMNQMILEYPQEIHAMQSYIAQAAEGTSYGGNNMIGPANMPQSVIGNSSFAQGFLDADDNSGDAYFGLLSSIRFSGQ